VVVPQSTNAASVPAVTFSFFDPLAKSYTTLSQGPFRLAFRPRETTAFEPYRPPAPARGPAPARPASVLRKAVASRRQAAAALAYWAVAAGALLALAARGKRRVLAALAVLAVASAAYLPFRAIVERAVFRTAEAVAERGATARLAPAGTALETFDLPAGSRVRVLEVFGHWAKIEFGDKRGWIPRESLHGLDELAVLPAAD
jgi:hypothetical protein